MLKGLIGKKIGMTQIFDENGAAYPVTLIEAGPCYVTQVRRPEKEGYSAVQLGFIEVNPKRLTGGELGHLKVNDLPPLRFLREFLSKSPDVNIGDTLKVDVFAVGEVCRRRQTLPLPRRTQDARPVRPQPRPRLAQFGDDAWPCLQRLAWTRPSGQ
jgi:hypothetical protein